MNLWALDSADLMQVLNCPKKRILFKVSNRLYLKLNKGVSRQAQYGGLASTLKLTSERASERAERITWIIILQKITLLNLTTKMATLKLFVFV